MPKQAEAASHDGEQAVPSALHELLRAVPAAAAVVFDPQQDPGAAFRAVFDAWVSLGGLQGGKPRRSAQQIKAWLGSAGRIPSLETKLAGKTRLPADEAHRLINLFLKHWDHDDEPHPTKQRGRLSAQLLLQFYPAGSTAKESGLLLPRRRRGNGGPKQESVASAESVPGDESRPSGEVISELFGPADALFTISRERTIIGTNPAPAMLGFQELIDALWRIDLEAPKFRALIWVVDIGRRQHDESAQLALQNLEFLATQLRALALTDHPDRHARWQWLRQHTAVVVAGLRRHEIDRAYAASSMSLPNETAELPWFAPDRLFFESLPDHWHSQPVYRGLLGPDEDAQRRRTVTVHARVDGWPGEGGKPPTSSRDEDQRADLRYWVHAPRPPTASEPDKGARCIELPRPNVRWGDVIRMALAAAFYRLGHVEPKLRIEPLQAIAEFRRHGFAIMTTPEFLRLSNELVEAS